MIAGNPKILGQAKGTATLASIYSPGTGVRAVVWQIIAANIAGSAGDVQICLDVDGTTYDSSNAIAWNVQCDAQERLDFVFDKGLWLFNTDSIGVFSTNANDHTFTVIGQEIT